MLVIGENSTCFVFPRICLVIGETPVLGGIFLFCFVVVVVVFAGIFGLMQVSGRVFVKIMLDFGGDRCPQLYS